MKDFLELLNWLAAADAGVLRWLLVGLCGYIAYLQRQMQKDSKDMRGVFIEMKETAQKTSERIVAINTWSSQHDEKDESRHADVQANLREVREKIHGLALVERLTTGNSRYIPGGG